MSNEMLEGAPLIVPSTTDHPMYDAVVEACRSVYDPEIPVNIYELGLIYTIDINAENEVKVLMSLTAPGCQGGSRTRLNPCPASKPSMWNWFGNRRGAWT
jgi:hypothetical protein